MSATIGKWTAGRHGDVPSLTAIVGRDDPATVLFIGDMHLDNPKADRRAIKRVLTEAVERDAAIVLIGDQFDAMQARNDRRSAKSALREQYVGRDDYLTAVLEDVSEFLIPYASSIWLVLDGNHESAIMKYNEVSLTRLLVHNLNSAGGNTVAPGYQTYGVLKTYESDDKKRGGHITPFWLTHGAGGSSPVTGGVISAQRRAVTYPDAAFVVSGHLHRDWYISHSQHRLSTTGRVFNAKQRHLQVSAWKNEHGNGASWAAEKGFPPSVASGWWCEVRRARGDNPVPRHRVRFSEAEAE